MRKLLVLFAAGLLASCGADSGATVGGGGGRDRDAGPVPVEVVLARTDTVVDAIVATGQIESVQSIELRPEVEGRIVEILAREGAMVAAGEPLFRIDDAELKAQVDRAVADRDLAQQNLERLRQLMADRAAAPADLERAEANARSAQAQLDLLAVRLERTLVRAPFAGVVGQRMVSLGDYVNSQSRLITLQTVDPQRAAFQVPERFARQLEVGQSVGFRVAALPGREFTGVVEFVDPVVQLPARTITIKARVSNRDRVLAAGMFIEARLVTATRPGATVVPEDALFPLPSGMVVWIVENGMVNRRPVEVGVRTPGFVEVIGVNPGEQVVVSGGDRLSQGGSVIAKVVERLPMSGREVAP